MRQKFVLALCLTVSGPVLAGEKQPAKSSAKEAVDFARDIQPVLTERCLSCHGPDMQESGLRVDIREMLLTGGDSESPAVVPNQSGKSLLMERITEKDPDSVMPPEGKPLTRAEVALFKRWIDAGAVMPQRFEQMKRTASEHWSFQPITRVRIPLAKSDWVQNPIDAFVFERLTKSDLTPATWADKRTLIRRVTFDLTGLPPTLAEVEAFLSDASTDAYQRLVNRLLASPA